MSGLIWEYEFSPPVTVKGNERIIIDPKTRTYKVKSGRKVISKGKLVQIWVKP